MKRTTSFALAALAFLVLGGLTVAVAPKATALDGKSFEVQLMKYGSYEGTPDTLSFANGTFDSSACHQYGFGKSMYTVDSSNDALVSFHVHAVSKDRSQEDWSGTVQGDRIHGTVTMTDSKGTMTRYKFKGKMVTT